VESALWSKLKSKTKNYKLLNHEYKYGHNMILVTSHFSSAFLMRVLRF